MKWTISVAIVLVFLSPIPASTQSPADRDGFQSVADRYHRLLAQRPRRGTALDLLYRYYLDAGKLDELVAHYEELTSDDSEDASAHMILGLLYERRGRFEEALGKIETAAKLAPQDFYPEYAAGLLHARQYQQNKAIEAFQRSLTKDPDRTHLLQISKTLGRLHLQRGELEQALEVWSRLSEAFPDDPFVLEELAELLAEEEQFEEAIKRYERLSDVSKGEPYKRLMARIEIGQVQVRQGKLKTAIETFNSCLDQVKPDSWIADDIRRRIEEIFVRGDDVAGLAEYYRQWLKDHPQDLAAMMRLAETLGPLGQPDAALAQYRAAVKLAPGRRDLREQLIDELARRQDYPAAISEVERQLEQNPDDTEHLQKLGELYLHSSHLNRSVAESRAVAAWKRIPEVRADDPVAAVRVAELCRDAAGIGSRLNNDQEKDAFREEAETPFGTAALDCYVEAVERAPDVPQYHEYLGEYLFAVGREEDAVTAWRKIAAPPHDTVENLKRVAQVFAGIDRFPEAMKALNQATEKEADRYDLHELATDLLVRQDQFDAALEHVTAMEQLADSNALMEEAIKKRVEVYRAAGRLGEEAAALAAQLQSGEHSLRQWWLASMLAAAQRRSTTALEYLERALELNASAPRLLRFKAAIHRQGGDLAGAADQYRRLAELEPKNRILHLKEVVALEMELGRFESAQKTAEEVVRLAPGNVEAAQLSADVYWRSGDADRGLAILRRTLRANPRDTEIRVVLARRLIDQQKTDEALEHLWRIFELSEDHGERLSVVAEMADQYAIIGQADELFRRLEKIRRRQENPLNNTLYLVEAYCRAEDFVSARRELNALLVSHPDDGRVLSQLVALSEQLKDNAAAIEYQKKIVESTRNADALGKLARLYSASGNDERAKEIWLELAGQAKEEESILTAIDRAMQNADFAQAITLAKPGWDERSDDWRFGYRLASAYWFAEQKVKATRVAREIQRLLPSSKFEKADSTASQQLGRSSYSSQYPPLVTRVSSPRRILSMLTNARGSGQYFSSWQPRELRDAQMFAAILIYEAARANQEEAALAERLRDRSESDLSAVHQLVWLQLARSEPEGLKTLLQRWIAENPSDPEPRLTLFLFPLMFGGGPDALPDVQEHLTKLKPQYEWFTESHPDTAAFLTAPYVQLLLAGGNRDEAIELARSFILQARTPTQLRQLTQMLPEIGSSQLLALLIKRIGQLEKSSPGGSASRSMVASVIQRHAQLAASEQDWEELLTSFDQYMTATHPEVAHPTAQSRPVANVSYRGYPATAPSARRNDRVGAFPGTSAWMDQHRLQMLQTVHRALRAAGKGDLLTELIEQRAKEAEGLARQCWSLCAVINHWLNNERAKAVQDLERFAQQVHDHIQIRMLLARAHSEMGEYAKALTALGTTQLAFGPMAKTLEQMRLELAQRANNEEIGRRAALRLFGMRLSSSEQSELASVMGRYGLTARSEALLKRAVRTASNDPAELYRLMGEHATNDPDRAKEIARILLRRTKRTGGTNDSITRYRLQALSTLDRAGELEPMIEKTKRQLAAAPNSVKLLEDLAEYYTAESNQEEVRRINDRILTMRPDDAKLHYRIVQSFFQANQNSEGIKRMGPVWQNDPQIALQNGHDLVGRYIQADALDQLAKHLATLKEHKNLLQQSSRVSQILSYLRSSSNDIDGTAKVYRVILDLMPAERKADTARQFGQFLAQHDRKNEAYLLYKQYLLPQSTAGEDQRTSSTTSGASYPGTSTMGSPIRPTYLADMARDTGKSKELIIEIETASEAHPEFKPLGQLLIAMLKRRSGNEAGIEAIARRYVEDDQFARDLAAHFSSLTYELDRCEKESSLRAALEVYTKGQPGRAGAASSGLSLRSSDPIRLAAIHMKLDEPEQARDVLLQSLQASSPSGYQPHSSAGDFSRHRQTADALKRHGFHLDAVAVYQQILAKVDNLPPTDHIRRYEAPRANQSMQESLQQLIEKQCDETLEALIRALKDASEDLARFCVVWDPLSTAPDGRNQFGPSVYPNPNSQRSAQAMIEAKKQLLPALLYQAREAQRLGEMETLVNERLAQLDDNSPAIRDRFRALRILMLLCGGTSAEAVGPLTSWLKRIRQAEDLAYHPETWLLALTALEQEDTRKIGQQLAVAVAQAAAQRGKSGRQQAAMLAISRSGENADTMIEKILADRKGDPQTNLQLAQAYFQQEQYSKAVETLKVVWRQAPELLIPQLRQLVDYYLKADRLDALAEGVRSVHDRNLRSQCSQAVANLFSRLPKQPDQALQVLDLYRAVCEFTPQASSSYFANRLSSYLRELPRNEKTLEVYQHVVFPDEQYEGQVAMLAAPFVQLAVSTERVAQMKQACQQAQEEYPKWEAKGQLLSAMLDQRAGDATGLVRLAKKYQSDPTFAVQLQGEQNLLRQELVRCDERPAVELALMFWKPLLVRESGSSVGATIQVAQLLAKLGDRQGARQTLLQRLDKPFSSSYPGSRPESVAQGQIQGKQSLADELARQDFTLDALRAYREVMAVDVSQLPANSYTRSRVARARVSAHNLLEQIVPSKVHSVAEQLHAALKSEDPGDAVAPFLMALVPQVSDTLPSASAQEEEEKTVDSIVLPLLEQLRGKAQLVKIKEAVNDALQTHDSDHRLLALKTIVWLTDGQSGEAAKDLERLSELVEETPQLANDAVWLAAREVMRSDPGNEAARGLIETVATTAGQTGNQPRQEAAVLALARALFDSGQSERASTLMRDLILGEDAKPQDTVRLAKILFRQKRGEEAVRMLEPLWPSQSRFLFEEIESLAPYYTSAGKMDALVEGIISITDQNLRSRYYQTLINTARQLGTEKQRIDEAIKLFQAATKFVPSESRNRDYAYSTYASFLVQHNRKPQAWRVYHQAVIPPGGPDDRLSSSVSSFARLTVELGKFEELSNSCGEAVKAHPQWRSCADFLIGMVKLQKDQDEQPLIEVARNYHADPGYAAPLRASSSIVRSEFAKLNFKPALETAAELWGQYLESYRSGRSSSSISYRYYGSLADVWIKLGKVDEAKELLLEAVDIPTPNYSSDYASYYQFQRYDFLAPKLIELGCPLEALDLLQQNLALEGTETAQQRGLSRRMADQKRMIRDAVLNTLSDHMMEAMEALQEALRAAPPQLETFFAIAAPPWTAKEAARIPEDVAARPVANTQLLPAILRRARSANRLEGIIRAVDVARSSHVDHELLAALNSFARQTRGGEEALLGLIRLSKSPQPDVRALAIAGLAEFQSDEALAAIIKAATDTETKVLAASVLQGWDSPQAAQALGSWLTSNDASLRMRVQEGLLQMQTPEARQLFRYEPVAQDEFDGAFSLDWNVDHPSPEHVSFQTQTGTVTINAQHGGFSGSNRDYQNLLLLENPIRGQDFRVTIRVTGFTPRQPYQQAALLIWNDADNYLKLSYESAQTGQPRLTVLPELEGRVPRRADVPVAEETDCLWLRLTRQGNRYAYESSSDGKTFRRHGWIVWDGGEPASFGLAAVAPGNPPPPAIDVSFDSFQLERPVGSAVISPRDLPIVAVSEALKKNPNDAQLWFQRANLLGRRCRWRDAAADYAKGLELDPEDHWAWYVSGTLQLQLGNQDAYEKLCRAMLSRFGNAKTPHIAERVGKICLMSCSPVDKETPMRLIDRALEGRANNSGIYHWFLMAKGIAEYRMGTYEEATDYLQKCRQEAPDVTPNYCMATDLLFLAMAHHQLGKTNQAKQDYLAALKLMADFPKDDDTSLIVGWNEWLMARMTRKEAEQLLKLEPTAPAESQLK